MGLTDDLDHHSLTSPHPSLRSESTGCQQLIRSKFLFLFFKDFFYEKQRNILIIKNVDSKGNKKQQGEKLSRIPSLFLFKNLAETDANM